MKGSAVPSRSSFEKMRSRISSPPSFFFAATFAITISVTLLSRTYYQSQCVLPEKVPQGVIAHVEARDLSDESPNEVGVSSLIADSLHKLEKKEQELLLKTLNVSYQSIWMGVVEVNMVLRHMNNIDTYLEWGSGGSTHNFPQFAKRAYSIEHDETWCTKMIDQISKRPELKHLQYNCVPIARGTKGWGVSSPFEEGDYKVFKKYVDQIDNLRVPIFDMVLIDGRARVDCAVKALSYIGDHSVVVVHDAERIWTHRKYARVLHYYDIVDSIGGSERQGIAIMRRKKKFQNLEGNHEAVQKMFDQIYPPESSTRASST
ncbi:hypothetical protein BWQ96_00303 [Gracilariopsis chorda]|uniref:Uncharacterized protein n=1 Tax=Gracilariopsis chorda TaxID=448386 RepID=A0A2V3J793_9FLOR|nr:hypothetical protein BWQ96_00303 [Gracilariopsis chorda]|eukprot:PXF50143.1 hypothetical protein BWQ96_00303 [Gracilariopsis chorda]